VKQLALIAAGGALGAAARYGLIVAWPAPEGGFPWAIFAVNVSGCLLIGFLMALQPSTPARLFLGTGVLGGYTTFSAYTLDFQRLIAAARPGLALVYLFGTLAAALVAVQTGGMLARAVRPR
jgi:CrcB protein